MSNYYVGINGTNVICNGEFFDGYITAYPMGENGNISYFDSVDTKEKLDEGKFCVWAQEKITEILKTDTHAQFTYFNKRMADICSILPKGNSSSHNDWELLKFLNDKFRIREYLSKDVRMLDYLHLKGANINYNDLKSRFGTTDFVLQSHTGSGGLTTHNISSQEDINGLDLDNDTVYSVSGYQENLPINATLMISEKDVYQMPISVQLIKNTGNFIYSGGDFVFPKKFNANVSQQISVYNEVVGRELQKLGYRGICGVDYIVCPDGTVKFMELNPRYQGSSFLLSLALKKLNTSIARLNAECFVNPHIIQHDIDIGRSFVNCKLDNDYSSLGAPDEIIKKVENSTFRKIYDRSICLEDTFERPDDLSSICCM